MTRLSTFFFGLIVAGLVLARMLMNEYAIWRAA